MEFANDTNVKARFDYFDLNQSQNQLTISPESSQNVEGVLLPSQIAVSLWENGEEVYGTLKGELQLNSVIAGVIMGEDGITPELRIL